MIDDWHKKQMETLEKETKKSEAASRELDAMAQKIKAENEKEKFEADKKIPGFEERWGARAAEEIAERKGYRVEREKREAHLHELNIRSKVLQETEIKSKFALNKLKVEGLENLARLLFIVIMTKMFLDWPMVML